MALCLTNPLRRLRLDTYTATQQITDARDNGVGRMGRFDRPDTNSNSSSTSAVDVHASSQHQPARAVAVGLVNTGNTCFVNAIVQCLAVLPTFQTSVARALETLQRHSQQHSQSQLPLHSTTTTTPQQQRQQQRLQAVTALLALLQSLAPLDAPSLALHRNTRDSDDDDMDSDSDDSDYSSSSDDIHRPAAAIAADHQSQPAPVDRETLSARVRTFLDATRPLTTLLAAPHATQEQQDAEEFLSFLLELLHELLCDARGICSSSNNSTGSNTTASQLDPRNSEYFRQGELYYARALAKCHPSKPQEYMDVVTALGDFRWQRFLKQHDSVITDLFVGQIVRGSQCCSCASLTCTHEEIRVLSLSVDATASAQTLANCLATYRDAESLVDDNRVFCERHCRMKTSRLTQVLIQRAPRLLIIQLQRFQQLQIATLWSHAIALTKIHAAVTFPIGTTDDFDNDDFDIFDTDALAGEANSNNPDDLLDVTDNLFVRDEHARVQYALVGVVAHVGATLDAGHYVSYVRRRDKRALWVRLDDDVVTELSASQVRSETVGTAYILFYTRVHKR